MSNADLDLAALEAAERAATPGPWESEMRDEQNLVRAVYKDNDGNRITAWPAMCACGAQPNGANAAFIAAIRSATPALIAAARRAAELERTVAGTTQQVALLSAENRSLHALLAKSAEAMERASAWLSNPNLGSYQYMESSRFYDDKDDHTNKLKAAVSEIRSAIEKHKSEAAS